MQKMKSICIPQLLMFSCWGFADLGYSTSNSTFTDLGLPQITTAKQDMNICVDSARYQEWTGHIDFGQCWYALSRLDGLVKPYRGRSFSFFSQMRLPYPSSDGWGLPFGYVDSECFHKLPHNLCNLGFVDMLLSFL